jgi:DNA-directed RNA polymerase specialized sigma24 family protein
MRTDKHQDDEPVEQSSDQMIALWWQGFLTGTDPTGFDQVFHHLAPRLLHHLQKRFSNLPVDDLEDAVAQAFEYLAMHPVAFDRKKGTLFGLLLVIGQRRVIDSLRHRKRWVALPSSETNEGKEIEPEIPDTRTGTEETAIQHLIYHGKDPLDSLRLDVEQFLTRLLPDPRDYALFRQMIDGRISVETFAILYACDNLPREKQQKALKQNRDRVFKRVVRERNQLRALLTSCPTHI